MPPVYGSDATGSFAFASCSFLERYRLELVHFQKNELTKSLVFTIPGNLELYKDWDVVTDGVECTSREHCEFGVTSKIQISHVSYRGGTVGSLTGKFSISFRDGRKLEGSFSAKGVKPSTKIICE
jgi:hypothetical protein